MIKVYPLEIESVGDDDYIVMSRGHHDPHEFMKAVRAAGYEWSLSHPIHRWVKRTPTKGGCSYNFVKQGVRGAFPATYAHEAYGESRYEPPKNLPPPDPELVTLLKVNVADPQQQPTTGGRDQMIGVIAALAAAISLLERGGRKAAPSDRMYKTMIADYKKALKEGRAYLRNKL